MNYSMLYKSFRECYFIQQTFYHQLFSWTCTLAAACTFIYHILPKSTGGSRQARNETDEKFVYCLRAHTHHTVSSNCGNSQFWWIFICCVSTIHQNFFLRNLAQSEVIHRKRFISTDIWAGPVICKDNESYWTLTS